MFWIIKTVTTLFKNIYEIIKKQKNNNLKLKKRTKKFLAQQTRLKAFPNFIC